MKMVLDAKVLYLAAALLLVVATAEEVKGTPYFASYNISYADVTLDHFNFQSNNTFPLRYLSNIESVDFEAEKPAPIFVLAGCENPVIGFWEGMGFTTMTLREKFNAAVLAVEHRYFGTSLPFGEASFSTAENIQYLTVEQALADHVAVIQTFQKEYGLEKSPVIILGGSYCGDLSAYMRMRYPWLIDGSIASAAPYRGYEGCTDPFIYNEILTKDYANYNPKCESIIRAGFENLKTFLTATPEELAVLSNELQLCTPLKEKYETYYLYQWLYGAYVSLALFDYPTPGFMPAYPLNIACEKAMDTDVSIPISASRFLSTETVSPEIQDKIDSLKPLVNAANVFRNRSGKLTCNEVFTAKMPGGLSTKAWAYISGTSFLVDTQSNGVTDMFWESPFALEARKVYLEDILGFPIVQRPKWLAQNFGCHPEDLTQYSNIIFSNGSIDPTTGISITESVSDSVVAFVMEGAAHGVDLLLPSPDDPEGVVKGREVEIEHITKWINEAYERLEKFPSSS